MEMTRLQYLELARTRARSEWERWCVEGIITEIQENSNYTLSYKQVQVVERNMDKPWTWQFRTYPADRKLLRGLQCNV